jgi:hypothetical protein
VSDLIGAGDSSQKPPAPKLPSCKYCGGIAAPMALLDSRQGKSFRLLRCLSCEKMSWSEDGEG